MFTAWQEKIDTDKMRVVHVFRQYAEAYYLFKEQTLNVDQNAFLIRFRIALYDFQLSQSGNSSCIKQFRLSCIEKEI